MDEIYNLTRELKEMRKENGILRRQNIKLIDTITHLIDHFSRPVIHLETDDEENRG